jgi:hypothetical protein
MSEAAPTLSVDAASDYVKGLPGMSSQTEPGFANTYGNGSDTPSGIMAAALPAAGIGALSLYLLYRRKMQDEQEAQKKQASFRSQLPGLHPKDILLGAAAGGGAGLLYDLAAGTKPGEKRLPKALKRILGGAAIGGAGANLIGDRARRYITNTTIPLDYDAADKVQQLMPGSLKRFIDAAILDKPSFNPKRVQEYINTLKMKGTPGDPGPDDLPAVINARRELNRIAFGVHTPNATADYWQYNKGDKGPGYYSVNESNPNYKTIREQLFGPRSATARGIIGAVTQYPAEAIAGQNLAKKQWRTSGLFGADTLMGGQQVALPPSAKSPQIGRVLDRFDVTPAQDEITYAQDAVKKFKIFNPEWWTSEKETPGYSNTKTETNRQFMGGLISRLIWDKILTEKYPWVSQQFRMSRAAPVVIPNKVYWPGKFELLKEDGTP